MRNDSQRTLSGFTVTPEKSPMSSTGPEAGRESHATKRPAIRSSCTDEIATAPESLLKANKLSPAVTRSATELPGTRLAAVSDTLNRPGLTVTVRTRIPTPVSPRRPSSVRRLSRSHHSALSGTDSMPLRRVVSMLAHLACSVPPSWVRHPPASTATVPSARHWRRVIAPPSG